MTNTATWFSDPDMLLAELRRGKQRREASPAISGYDEFRELSRGGQGIVFAAVQRSTRRRVAVKVLLDGAFASPAARRRFEREIELVATLEHPGVVRIFDSGTTDDGRLYYVMEFIEGVPLDEWMAWKRDQGQKDGEASRHRGIVASRDQGREASRQAPLGSAALREMLTLFASICDAIHYAHQRGVIHRDLKPSNIRIDRDGRAHVLDFGLAKPARGDDGETALPSLAVSVTGQFVGSVPWSSPEQAEGAPDAVDLRTDVYSLGVILYQMLTGAFPYDVSGTLQQALHNIAQAEPRKPGALARGINDELDTIALKALSKDPARRYQTAGDLAADVRRHLAGEPIDAKRDSTWYIMRKTARRYRTALAVLSLLVLTLAAGFVATAWQWRQAEIQRDRAERRFNDVRELARAFMFDVHDRIADLAGARPAREVLVQTALRYLEELAAESDNDDQLALEIAYGYQRIGDILGNPFNANLGNTAEALDKYRRGLALLESHAPNPPDPREWHRLIASLHHRLGDVMVSQGDRAAALPHYEQAMSEFERMLSADPADRINRRNVATTHLKIGDLLALTNDSEAALQRFRAAAETFESLLAEPVPEDETRDRFNLQLCCSKIGFMLGQAGDTAGALAQQRRALEISQSLADADPANAVKRRSVEINHNQVGAMLATQGEHDEAMRHFQAALAIAQQLAAADPANVQAQIDLTYTRNKIGELHWSTGHLPAALEQFEAALAVRRELAAKDPTHGSLQRDLAVSLAKIGEVQLKLAEDTALAPANRRAHADQARDHYRQCLEVLTQMKANGTLSERDAALPDEIAAAVTQCDALLAAHTTTPAG